MLKNDLMHSLSADNHFSGGRFKHAFKLDHKQHHAQKADAPAMANDV